MACRQQTNLLMMCAIQVRDIGGVSGTSPSGSPEWMQTWQVHGQGTRVSVFYKLLVILVAYSGGYFPAAWCLKNGGVNHRIARLVLMDALCGNTEKFAAWVEGHHKMTFMFNTHSKAGRKWNIQLQYALTTEDIGFSEKLPNSQKKVRSSLSKCRKMLITWNSCLRRR